LFVIPQLRLVKCARLLSEQFTELRVFRLTEPACLQFNQIVVLARRRKRHSRLPDAALLDGVRCLEMLSAKSDLEPLGDVVDVRYEIPTSEPIVLTNMGIPLDEVEDLLLETSAYRQAGRVLLPKLGDVKGRPLTPLHGGLGIDYIVAGILNARNNLMCGPTPITTSCPVTTPNTDLTADQIVKALLERSRKE